MFVATDASENTRKKIKDKSSYYEVPCFELFSEAEITQSKELRSEEHTSELQSLARISYAVFCLKKKKEEKK